jgi:DNA-binding MarR family transcriptional regulator
MGAHTSSAAPSPPREAPAADHTRHILDSMRRIVQVLRVASRAAETRVGLSAAQLYVHQKLAEAPGSSVNDLARRTRTHQSSVSVVVRRLVTRGLVARGQSDRDGRRVELSLTPRGRALARRAPAAAQERLITALDALPDAHRRRLAALLERVVDASGMSQDLPTMLFEDEG